VGERAVGASVRAEDDPVRAEPDEGGAHVRDEILEKGARVPEITEIRSLRLSANSQIMRTALLEKMQESFINFARQNEDCMSCCQELESSRREGQGGENPRMWASGYMG
jgi:hypothetical protein